MRSLKRYWVEKQGPLFKELLKTIQTQTGKTRISDQPLEALPICGILAAIKFLL